MSERARGVLLILLTREACVRIVFHVEASRLHVRVHDLIARVNEKDFSRHGFQRGSLTPRVDPVACTKNVRKVASPMSSPFVSLPAPNNEMVYINPDHVCALLPVVHPPNDTIVVLQSGDQVTVSGSTREIHRRLFGPTSLLTDEEMHTLRTVGWLEALKDYRIRTGVSLVEAKSVIDEARATLPKEDNPKAPERVFWIVTEGNDPDYCADGEFGVEVNGVPYLYYKWPDALPDDKEKLKYRRIHKCEFGEVIRRPKV